VSLKPVFKIKNETIGKKSRLKRRMNCFKNGC